MRLLLDTHSFLWFTGGDERLSMRAKEIISDVDNAVYLSVASLWEIAVKINVGKLKLPQPFGELIPEQLILNEIEILNVELPHLTSYIGLPLHRDPFDRLIIAQAKVEEMWVVGKDREFEKYEIERLW